MGCTLVIDTSFGSTVGIVGREPIVETDSRTHVEKLQVNIARAVEEAGLTPADIEEIVVGIGPAPLTGLRAGSVALDEGAAGQALIGIERTANLYVVFWIMVVTVVVLFMFGRSRYGRAVKAIRDDEIAAGASGLNTTYLKVLVFAISAFFAGIAGGIFAQYIGSLNPTMAGWLNSINYVIMVVFGGMGSLTGSIVSAIGLTILPELLRAFADYRMLAYSVVLVLVMIFRPQGIFGSWEFSLPRLVNRMLFRGAAGKGAKPADSAKQHDQSDDKTVKEASR